MKRAFGPTGSTTSTCRRGPTRCGRTRRPARLETAAARGCGRVVLRRRLGAPRRRVPRTPREAPATGAGARRRPRGTVGHRRVSVCVYAFYPRSVLIQKGRTEPHSTQEEWGPIVICERRARAARSNRRGDSGRLCVPGLPSSSQAVRNPSWGRVSPALVPQARAPRLLAWDTLWARCGYRRAKKCVTTADDAVARQHDAPADHLGTSYLWLC